jgi:very-short-patch-repair endonuclease
LAAKIARGLRRRATDAERLLWRHLRNRQIAGVEFRRQKPNGPFIVDFVAMEHRLVVEIDGGQHARMTAADRLRSVTLENAGYRVIRFWNNDVLQNIDGVLERIREALFFERPDRVKSPTLTPTLSRPGGRGGSPRPRNHRGN